MKNVEFVAYLWKGNARTINNPSSKQLIRAPQVDETKHPTEKPVGLCRHYIENSSAPGDLVLDPFMGSGTTVVAALRAGRRAVGVEQDPQWFDVACRRVERATATSGELFA
jgi:site-specific DNA-methyltransferase (adenine-specific)